MHPLAETGRVIAGRYRLEAPIGRGAMGVVWRARDQLLDREVAVKEVQIADSLTEEERTNAYQRTLREAKTAARLSHPGVVTVYDVAEDGGRPWIVMELINSQSLDRVLGGSGPLSPRRAAAMGRQLLSALSVAHAAGVLHRDVKPSNVLLGNDDRAVLTDFGIATFQGDPKLTQTGMVMGSPGFTAPERIRGGAASPASDLWSLGATIYAAVQGHGPYEQRGGAITTMSAIINEDAPSAPSAGALGRVIDSLLRREPDDRPDAATASRMIADILHLLPDKSTVTTDGYEATALSAASPPRAAASAQTSLDAAAPAVAAVAGQAADEPADRAAAGWRASRRNPSGRLVRSWRPDWPRARTSPQVRTWPLTAPATAPQKPTGPSRRRSWPPRLERAPRRDHPRRDPRSPAPRRVPPSTHRSRCTTSEAGSPPHRDTTPRPGTTRRPDIRPTSPRRASARRASLARCLGQARDEKERHGLRSRRPTSPPGTARPGLAPRPGMRHRPGPALPRGPAPRLPPVPWPGRNSGRHRGPAHGVRELYGRRLSSRWPWSERSRGPPRSC